ncbi:MAG: orotidine 5'-phosphate decarboxylase / HUMPS family protein [Streptosporangiaceae bacterium]
MHRLGHSSLRSFSQIRELPRPRHRLEEDRLLLQLAIDDPGHIGLVNGLAELVDIIEVGTPLLKRFGLAAIATLKQAGGGTAVLVDSKTVDGGAREARMLFEEGAAFVTVLSTASAATHQAVSEVASEYDGHVLVDTICAPALPTRYVSYPDRFAYLGLHLPTDQRLAGQTTAEHIDAIPAMRELGYQVAIAGGISPGNIAAVVAAAPDLVIVGSAITHSPDPRRACKWIGSQLTDRNHGWPRPPRSMS